MKILLFLLALSGCADKAFQAKMDLMDAMDRCYSLGECYGAPVHIAVLYKSDKNPFCVIGNFFEPAAVLKPQEVIEHLKQCKK